MTAAMFLLACLALAALGLVAFMASTIRRMQRDHAEERRRILDAIMALQTGGPAGNFAALANIAANSERPPTQHMSVSDDEPMPAFAGFGDG